MKTWRVVVTFKRDGFIKTQGFTSFKSKDHAYSLYFDWIPKSGDVILKTELEEYN